MAECKLSIQVRDLVLMVEGDWGRHRLSGSGLYMYDCTHTYQHTYTYACIVWNVHIYMQTIKNWTAVGRYCPELWREIWCNSRNSCKRGKGHLELEEVLWWQTQWMWDVMWLLALRRERAKECGLPVEAVKGKKHILPRAPEREETGSAVRLISAQWGALVFDFWHLEL